MGDRSGSVKKRRAVRRTDSEQSDTIGAGTGAHLQAISARPLFGHLAGDEFEPKGANIYTKSSEEEFDQILEEFRAKDSEEEKKNKEVTTRDDLLHEESEDEECENGLTDSVDEEDVPHIPSERLTARQRDRREHRVAKELALRGLNDSNDEEDEEEPQVAPRERRWKPESS